MIYSAVLLVASVLATTTTSSTSAASETLMRRALPLTPSSNVTVSQVASTVDRLASCVKDKVKSAAGDTQLQMSQVAQIASDCANAEHGDSD